MLSEQACSSTARRDCHRRRYWRRHSFEGGERAVALAPSLTCTRIGWRVVAAMNCSSRVNSSLTGRPVLQRRQRHDVLDQHFLLAAEAAADALAEHAHLARDRDRRGAQARAWSGTDLRAGANVEPAVGVHPADGGMRLQMRMLDRCVVIGRLRRTASACAKPAATSPISPCTSATILRAGSRIARRGLVVHARRAGQHRLLGIEHRRQQLVVDAERGSLLRPRPRCRPPPQRRAGR